jgi:hypothetical protein
VTSAGSVLGAVGKGPKSSCHFAIELLGLFLPLVLSVEQSVSRALRRYPVERMSGRRLPAGRSGGRSSTVTGRLSITPGPPAGGGRTIDAHACASAKARPRKRVWAATSTA